jgi:hypothetical protein
VTNAPDRAHQAGTGPELVRRRNTSRPIILIGFLRQGNLGLGYLSAVLRQFGYRVEVLDFEQDPAALAAAARRIDPLLVGSLIFQFYVRRFEALAARLREASSNAISPAVTSRACPARRRCVRCRRWTAWCASRAS